MMVFCGGKTLSKCTGFSITFSFIAGPVNYKQTAFRGIFKKSFM